MSSSLSDSLPVDLQQTRLRLLRMADLRKFQDYRSDQELAKYQGWSAMSDEAGEAFVKNMSTVSDLIPGDWIQLAIADSTTDLLIGDIGIFLEEGRTFAEIGFTLDRHYHGRGHATCATLAATRLVFKNEPINYVQAITDARNISSIRVLERSGFHKNGERTIEFEGMPCLEFVYSLRRSQ